MFFSGVLFLYLSKTLNICPVLIDYQNIVNFDKRMTLQQHHFTIQFASAIQGHRTVIPIQFPLVS